MKSPGCVPARGPLALVFALVLAFCAGCAEPPPAEFFSKADGFQVRFGGVPAVTEKTVGGLRSVRYSVAVPDGARVVAVTELPLTGDEPAEATSQVLRSAQEDLIRGGAGTLRTGSSVTLAGKHPGRDFTALVSEPKPGLMRARIYLVGTRLYQVMVLGAEPFVDSPAAVAFLDSFRLTR